MTTPGQAAAFISLCASHGTTVHTLAHGLITPATAPIVGGIT